MNARYLFLLLLIHVATLACAQPDPVDISETTAPGTVPFDRGFTINYKPTLKKKISSVQLFELDKCGCMKPFQCCTCSPNLLERICRKCRDQDTPDKVYSIPIRFVQPDSGVANLIMPSLGPNRKFMVVIASESKPPGIDKVVVDLQNNKDGEAKLKYDDIVSKTRFTASNGNTCSNCEANFELQKFEDFKMFYAAFVKPTADSLKAAETAVSTTRGAPPVMTSITGGFDRNILKTLIGFSQQCLLCTDTLWQQLWLSSNREPLSRAMVNIENLSQAEVYGGQVDINSYFSAKSVTGMSTTASLTNLTMTISLVANLIEFTQYMGQKAYGTAIPNDYSTFLSSLKQAQVTLKANYAALAAYQAQLTDQEKEVSRIRKVLDRRLENWEGFTSVIDAAIPSTFSYNFDTRAGYAIKADFGFLVYGGLRDNSSLRGLAPFVGFHINFRPMNTDIPFRQINCKGLFGHLSFHSGVLVGSFKKDGERDGLIGNTALFTGLGWAFGHGVRITGGTIWFQQKDPDPLVNDMHVSAAPYAGLALDLRLNDIYKSFKTIFTP